MCLLWYKQWLPEINIGRASAFARQADPRDAPTYFVARILGQPPDEDDDEQLASRGLLLLFAYQQAEPADQRTPARTIAFQLDREGNATVVEELPPGLYTAFAFLDLNENGKLDFDAQGTPLEPFQTSAPTSEPQDFHNLAPAAFELTPANPYFCVLRISDLK